MTNQEILDAAAATYAEGYVPDHAWFSKKKSEKGVCAVAAAVYGVRRGKMYDGQTKDLEAAAKVLGKTEPFVRGVAEGFDDDYEDPYYWDDQPANEKEEARIAKEYSAGYRFGERAAKKFKVKEDD